MRIGVKGLVFGGDDWLLASFDAAVDAFVRCTALQATAQKLRNAGHWLEVVPSTHDLAVRFDPMRYMPDEAKALFKHDLRVLETTTEYKAPTVMRMPVCYSGTHAPDLAYCAKRLAMSCEQIIALHTAAPLLVQMMGFAPGFAYCGETPPALNMPRLEQPRAHVAEGSVGIVGRQSCIYSLASPGGWPIIGRTPRALFSARLHNPFLLSAGSSVHFYAISEVEFDEYKGRL